MTPLHKDHPEHSTYMRILEGATRLFADNGFEKTTIRQICETVGVNVAAINYHFGDKEALYFEVLAHAHREIHERHPILGGVSLEASGEAKLRAFIHSFLFRISAEDESAIFGRLMAHEMMQPTKALDHLVEIEIRPKAKMLRHIINEVAGRELPEDALRRLSYSIVGQVLFYKHACPVVDRLTPELKFNAGEIEALADHITAFSMAGIQATTAGVVPTPTG